MNYDNFRKQVIAGTTRVICPQIFPDMEEGWEEEMDSMVGIPLLVEEKTKRGVYLSNEYGDTYLFSYHCVELAEESKQITVFLGKYKFLIEAYINTRLLKAVLLELDKECLSKIVGIDLDYPHVSIRSEHLLEIQHTCPRVIGALLSQNLMKRVN
jgi:hypothetical protein